MDDLPLSMIGFLVFLLFLSAFFSSAETAYSSVNKIRLKNYADNNRSGAKRALFISQHFDKALSTILVGNNLANIAAATISAKLATDLFGGNTGLLISTVVMTILILVFGEVLPKSFAKENAESLSLAISSPLLLLMKLFAPITWVFVYLKSLLSKLVGPKERAPSVTEEEIKVMVDLIEEEGTIDKKEKELVHRSLEFNDIKVGEILKSRTDMVAVEVHQSIEEVKNIFLEERFSRIPVYEGNIDNIIGILSEREFLTALVQNKEVHIREMVKKPLLVVESMKIAALLPELQKNKIHMGIVLDEFGGTAGLITMEDILEELVGEIWDEHDEKVNLITQIDDHTYEFLADFALDDFARITEVELPDSNYHTLGGWILEEFQRVPHVGEQFEYEHVTISIAEADARRIRRVKVVVKEKIHQSI